MAKVESKKMRIRLKAYDHRVLDTAVARIIETVKRTGGEVSGPVPLPTEVQKITVLKAVIQTPPHSLFYDFGSPDNTRVPTHPY